MASFEYAADGATVRRFFNSDAFVRGIRGPVGSGKSVACCVEVFRRSVEQKPSLIDGIRKSRWVITRNTQPELKTTTIKTWLDWFPEKIYGKFNWSPPFTHRIRRSGLDLEVIFLALDKPDDVKKLLSLELTGLFINEAREVPKAIVDGATMRVGRYPSEREGGPSWSGVIMDTNSPDEDHWWAIMSGEKPPPEFMSADEIAQLVKPKDWEFFKQPGAMQPIKGERGKILGWEINPARENQKGIKTDYYERMIAGKTTGWISVYVGNEYGTLTDGKPVYPDFDRALHVSPVSLLPVGGVPLTVGMDFGLTPSAIFCQKVRGQWRILREIVTTDMGAKRFGRLVKEEAVKLGGTFNYWGDPTGDNRVGTDEDTVFRVLRESGIMVRGTHTNDPAWRIDAVEAPLLRLVDKQVGLLVDPGCKNIIAGFEGGYHYKRMQVTGAERFEDLPNKNRFSHPHDALQYAMLGGGEGKALVGQGKQAVTVANRNFDVFAKAKLNTAAKPRLKGW